MKESLVATTSQIDPGMIWPKGIDPPSVLTRGLVADEFTDIHRSPLWDEGA
jgi:hypothetical protein